MHCAVLVLYSCARAARKRLHEPAVTWLIHRSFLRPGPHWPHRKGVTTTCGWMPRGESGLGDPVRLSYGLGRTDLSAQMRSGSLRAVGLREPRCPASGALWCACLAAWAALLSAQMRRGPLCAVGLRALVRLTCGLGRPARSALMRPGPLRAVGLRDASDARSLRSDAAWAAPCRRSSGCL